jgi:hypothetical protein
MFFSVCLSFVSFPWLWVNCTWIYSRLLFSIVKVHLLSTAGSTTQKEAACIVPNGRYIKTSQLQVGTIKSRITDANQDIGLCRPFCSQRLSPSSTPCPTLVGGHGRRKPGRISRVLDQLIVQRRCVDDSYAYPALSRIAGRHSVGSNFSNSLSLHLNPDQTRPSLRIHIPLRMSLVRLSMSALSVSGLNFQSLTVTCVIVPYVGLCAYLSVAVFWHHHLISLWGPICGSLQPT